MLRRSAVPLLLVCLTLTTFGQSPTHEHMTAPTDAIDGAKTPNLIPDVVAWRLWMLAVTAEDKTKPELATRRRHAFLRMAGVPEDEMAIADDVLAHFKTDYEALIANYNKRVESNDMPSFTEFRTQRDAIVQATQTSLVAQIAPLSASQLKSFINAEKTRMKVAREEAQ